ncbi:MAG: EAL domain-containing protein [Woeseiaceae bacterium]
MQGLKLASSSEIQPGASNQMVLVVDSDGIICDVLQAPQNIDSSSEVDLSGASIDKLWSDELSAKIISIIKRTIRGREVYSTDLEHETRGGHYESIFVPHGRDRALIVIRDISARRTQIDKMQKLAYVDDATKLPNREYLLDELRSCVERSRLTEGRAAVVCIEIGHSDVHGNIFSSRDLDVILRELAARITHELRGANQPDMSDNDRYSIAARIDFRRFGVVLPCIDSGTDAEGVAERLCDAIRQPIKLGARKVAVMTRAGISLFPQDGTDAETLFENGVVAMEDAVNGEAVHIKFHSGTVKLRALQRQDIEQELRTALVREEFELNFLPIIDANTNHVVAVEALLRWPQTTLTTKSIQQIVAVAERTGLIRPIANWVIKTSCEQLLRWHEAGHESLRIAINLSAQEFSQPDLIERLTSITTDLSVNPSFIDLEINEYMLFRDAMKEYTLCNDLKAHGFGVVVDDYGTGVCSLAHLSRSPVDAIKIDNCFVASSMENPCDKATCAAVSAMASELGIKVIAEGVENESQVKMLRMQGCDYLQGFYFGKPSSADDISDYLCRSSAQMAADE